MVDFCLPISLQQTFVNYQIDPEKASLVSEVKDFPAVVVELKKTIISPTPNASKICDLTRDSLRVLDQHPECCVQLRAHSSDSRFKLLEKLVGELR